VSRLPIVLALAAAGCQVFAGIEDLQLTSGTSGGGATGVGGTGASGGGSSGGCDIPGGGSILVEERFEDLDLGSRGWYDGPGGVLSADAAEGAASFECELTAADNYCTNGRPGRILFADTERVYLSFFLKRSAGFVGDVSLMVLLTNEDDDFTGPGFTHFSGYSSLAGDDGILAFQDGANVDTACLLQNDDSFIGCDGDFDTYAFSENRSAASCNGRLGDVELFDCSDGNGDGNWWSWRGWSAGSVATDDAWHLVELYYEMNSIDGGIGVPDGKLRWVQDGQTLLCKDDVLLRTGAHEAQRLVQLATGLYMDAPPAAPQTLWIDHLVVATGRP
jgi:hypothetical protein